jgi:Superinfection immunity protein
MGALTCPLRRPRRNVLGREVRDGEGAKLFQSRSHCREARALPRPAQISRRASATGFRSSRSTHVDYDCQLMRHASAAALLIFFAFGSGALSFDITTLNGTVYHDARVTTVDPDGLHVAHRFGVAKIPFEELPEDLRTKYHYDKQKAAAYRQQLSARQGANRPATSQRQSPAARQRVGLPAESRQRQQPGPAAYPTELRRIMAIIVSSGVVLLLVGLGIVMYFLPTFVGLRKQNASGIFLLNLLLGWTLAGWIAAFIWAWKADPRADPIGTTQN